MTDRKAWNETKKKLNETYSIPKKSVDKLGKLIKIEGTHNQVKKEISITKGLVMRRNLLKEVNKFSGFLDYCEWVGINRNFVHFDMGMVLKEHHIFYSGYFFKIVCTGNNEELIVANEKLLAYGGRYDNQVSHFDVPTRTSNMFAVGC